MEFQVHNGLSGSQYSKHYLHFYKAILKLVGVIYAIVISSYPNTNSFGSYLLLVTKGAL